MLVGQGAVDAETWEESLGGMIGDGNEAMPPPSKLDELGAQLAEVNARIDGLADAFEATGLGEKQDVEWEFFRSAVDRLTTTKGGGTSYGRLQQLSNSSAGGRPPRPASLPEPDPTLQVPLSEWAADAVECSTKRTTCPRASHPRWRFSHPPKAESRGKRSP
jgi:hypothetical protein